MNCNLAVTGRHNIRIPLRQVTLTWGASLPVGQSHALEEFGQRGVYGEVTRAGFAEVVRLTGLFVYSVEVVALLRWVLAVGRRHHEVTAVDDL